MATNSTSTASSATPVKVETVTLRQLAESLSESHELPKKQVMSMLEEMVTTVTLRAVSCGTELNVVQEGIPDVIPTEMCYLGWQESLDHLARLVEPEIPD